MIDALFLISMMWKEEISLEVHKEYTEHKYKEAMYRKKKQLDCEYIMNSKNKIKQSEQLLRLKV